MRSYYFFFSVSLAVAATGFVPATAQSTDKSADPTNSQEAQCVETDQIASYKVENDKVVRLLLKNNQQILLRLKRHCPQLHFHRYISYTPVDGKICAGNDEIKTRAGLACRIGSLTPISPATKAPSVQASRKTAPPPKP